MGWLTFGLGRSARWHFLLILTLTVVAWWLFAPGIASAQTAVIAPAAPTANPVSIPYGEWIASLLAWARDALVALAALAAARWVPATLRQYLTNEVLAKAVDYAIAATDGAVKGQALSLPVASAVVRAAEDYVIANAPAMARDIGALLRPKILARISAATPVASTVTAASVFAAIPKAP